MLLLPLLPNSSTFHFKINQKAKTCSFHKRWIIYALYAESCISRRSEEETQFEVNQTVTPTTGASMETSQDNPILSDSGSTDGNLFWKREKNHPAECFLWLSNCHFCTLVSQINKSDNNGLPPQAQISCSGRDQGCSNLPFPVSSSSGLFYFPACSIWFVYTQKTETLGWPVCGFGWVAMSLDCLNPDSMQDCRIITVQRTTAKFYTKRYGLYFF